MSSKPLKRQPGSPRPPKVTPIDAQTLRLELDDQASPAHWPTVSLCMIVKNEEKNLADCLASVGDFASEVIIVDTGSTDRTVEIARASGARVEYFAWIDDFSAARNESIRYATGDWIFWMDADDRLAPNELNRLKNALVSGLAQVYSCRVVSGVGRDSSVATTATVTHARLFPNHRGLHFVNALHEDITPVAMGLGLTAAETNITIHHTGYTADPDTMQARGARNEKIVRREMAKEPRNRRLYYDLAVALYLQDDYSQTIENMERFLVDPPEYVDKEIYVYHAHVILIAAYGKLGQSQATNRAVEKALAVFPKRRHLWVTAGIVHWQQSRFAEAVTAFEQARLLSPDSDLKGYTYLPGQLEKLLSRPYWLLGDFNKAAQVYHDMLAQLGIEPRSLPPNPWRQAQTLFAAQDYAGLDKFLAPLAAGDARALRLLSKAAVEREAWPQAFFYLLDAIILSVPEPEEWLDLTTIALKAGMAVIAECIGQLWLAQADHPEAQAVARNLLGMSAFQQQDFAQATEHFCRALVTRPDQHQAALSNLKIVAQALKLPLEQVIQLQAARWLKQEAYSEALSLLDLTRASWATPAEGYKLMALALQKLGRDPEAIQLWHLAQTLAGKE